MYAEHHRWVADLLTVLDEFEAAHPESNPYIKEVTVAFDDEPFGTIIDEIGGAYCFVPHDPTEDRLEMLPDGTLPKMKVASDV